MGMVTDTGTFVMFKNSSTRTVDGGAKTTTLRNDDGDLKLAGASDSPYIYLKTSSGSVGIGNSTPPIKLWVPGASTTTGIGVYNGDVAIILGNTGGGVNGGSIQVKAGGSSSTIGTTNYSLLLNPDGGNVGIGSAAPAYTLDVSGTIRATGDVIAYSDSRVKTDLKLIDNALNKVSNIHGYTFLRTDTENPVRQAGVIAQEVREILPEVVYKDDKGMYNVAYGNMVALLIEAIKEERQKREALEERITLMEGFIEGLVSPPQAE
jgi:hypothetical protein